MNIMYTDKNVYRIEIDRQNARFVNNMYKYICTIRIFDNTINHLVLELKLSENDIVQILDRMYSYIVFGGYDSELRLYSFNNNMTYFRFVFIKDTTNWNTDILSIEESKMGHNYFSERLRLIFSDDETTEFGLMEFFIDLYDEFAYDIVTMEDLAPDFVAY